MVVYREDGPITIGTVSNSAMLDGLVVNQFGTEVMRHLQGRTGVHLLLDFQQVEYLSSAALTELIKISDAVVAGGGALRICGLTPHIQKVFEITRFDKAFDIHAGETVAHAVSRFKRSIDIRREEEAWDKRSR